MSGIAMCLIIFMSVNQSVSKWPFFSFLSVYIKKYLCSCNIIHFKLQPWPNKKPIGSITRKIIFVILHHSTCKTQVVFAFNNASLVLTRLSDACNAYFVPWGRCNNLFLYLYSLCCFIRFSLCLPLLCLLD